MVRMSMAGLGHAWDLVDLPFHTFHNLKAEYIRAMAPPEEKKSEDTEMIEIAPNVSIERSTK